MGWFLLGMAAGFILLMALCAAFPPRQRRLYEEARAILESLPPPPRIDAWRDEAGAVEGGRVEGEGR